MKCFFLFVIFFFIFIFIFIAILLIYCIGKVSSISTFTYYESVYWLGERKTILFKLKNIVREREREKYEK